MQNKRGENKMKQQNKKSQQSNNFVLLTSTRDILRTPQILDGVY